MKTGEAAVMSTEDITKEMDVDLQIGLSAKQVAKRQKLYGENEIKGKGPDPLWKKYLFQFREPMVLLLLGSAVVSLCLQQFDDAISITVAIIIVCTVAFIQEFRSEKAIEALRELMPPKCYCLRDGTVHSLYARELVPGDIVILHMGDRVPADVRLVEANDLCVDESSFTGEVEPVLKNTVPVTVVQKKSIPVGTLLHMDRKQSVSSIGSAGAGAGGSVASGGSGLQRQPSVESLSSQTQQQQHTLVANMVYLGTLIRCGSGKGIVTATANHTEFGELFVMMLEEDAPRTPLQKSMDSLGKQLTIASFIIIGGIVVVGLFQNRKILETFTIAVSLAVAAIPEGLPIVVTVTLALGQIRMAKRKAIVKKLPAVETLGCVNVVCSDKTGTLTKNEMTVTKVYTTDDIHAVTTGVGYFEDGELWTEDRLQLLSADTCPSLKKLAEIGLICNNANLENGELQGQPTEAALICFARKLLLPDLRKQYTRVEEIPFNSENKIMTVKCIPIQGSGGSAEEICFMKGALDRILRRCSHVWTNEEARPLTSEVQARLLALAASMGHEGLRVLALARSIPGKSHVMACHGLVGILDPPRPGVGDAVAQLQKGGVRVCMVTGDAKETACAIGERLGIYHGVEICYGGDEVENMSVEQLATNIHACAIFYRTTPKHKFKIIKAYQIRGFVVAMTGDGVNDAVALRTSDIGLAMGCSGTDVCKEAADIVLVDDDFSTILAAIEEGKGIFYNIRNFIRFQMSTSISALSLVAISTIFFLPNPLNAMQILWINILMDGPPAQSLGVEKVDSDVIRQPPRSPKERILNSHLLGNVALSALIITAGTLTVFYWQMNVDGMVTPRDTTMTFTCFVFFDMFNALSSRSQTKSIFTIGFTTNRFFLVAVTCSVIGQLLVIYLPPLQIVFQTEALSFTDLVVLVALTSTIFWISEIKKLIERYAPDSTCFLAIRQKLFTEKPTYSPAKEPVAV